VAFYATVVISIVKTYQAVISMEWVFGVLTIGSLAILIKMMLDYSSEASEWHAKVQQAEAEREVAESQVAVFIKGKEEALARTNALEAELKSLENMRTDLKNKIEEMKKQHAKKGKVILHRQEQQGQQ
jgi:hypothetical protein